MAEQDSKILDENSTQNTDKDKTNTDESSAETTESEDKSPSKNKSPAKETKTKKESKKTEESDEDSDDEELVGSLDAPLVVEGKRMRKSTEFLSNTLPTPQSIERKRIDIPEGKGATLGSMARVVFQLHRVASDELKPLHRVLFGRPGTSSEVKRNIRAFNGFNIEKGSKEYKKKEEQIDRFTLDSLKRLCEILDVEKKGKKEEMLERVMDFLLCPKASGKAVPETGKRGAKSSTKRKRPAKEEKSGSKKKKSDETTASDEDSDGEKEEEKEKEPPAKKAKTPAKKKGKKESKKPVKKEKKVVSIKISPGKKSKKAKEKKKESDDSSDEEPLIKKTKKTPPTNDEIVELVKELLEGADLEKITMKSVCKQVYERFPDFDLTDRKEFIKDSVKEIIT